jgi:tRNA uridine 5-carbamoylmethylation protein Kti12
MSQKKTLEQLGVTSAELIKLHKATDGAAVLAASMMEMIELQSKTTAEGIVAVATLQLYYEVNFPRLTELIRSFMDRAKGECHQDNQSLEEIVREYLAKYPEGSKQ